MKKISIFLVIVALLITAGLYMAGCSQAEAVVDATAAEAAEEVTETTDDSEVVAGNSYHFILVNNMVTWSHFYPDYIGAQTACEDIKAATGDEITFEVVGPSENNIMAKVEAMESAIAKNPDGFMVICWDSAMLQSPINKAMAAGIPVVTIDADSPDSDRLCYIGTDWTAIGEELGKALMREIDGKGKVAGLMLVGADNMETAWAAFERVVAEYPDVEIIAKEHDNGQPEESARITAALIQANPDIAGFAGFDAGSGPGIVTAVKEAGKAGVIKVVGNDINTPQLQAVAEGSEQFIIGQKREFFGYYGVTMLYQHLTSSVKFTDNDEVANIINIPPTCDNRTSFCHRRQL